LIGDCHDQLRIFDCRFDDFGDHPALCAMSCATIESLPQKFS
jgi:hypothetical protein